MNDHEKRQSIIDACLYMNSSGLNHGTSGNISLRHKDGILLTPSSIPYEEMTPDQICYVPFDQNGAYEGPKKPSTEWRFHLDVQRARPDFNVVVHTHSPFATIIAIMRKNIPAIHYMIAAFGGTDIRCCDYARYGTAELSENVVKALDGRSGCLMANHGMLVGGTSLPKAMWLARELENLASQYYHTLQLGGGHILSDAQIAEVAEGFKSYGLQDKEGA